MLPLDKDLREKKKSIKEFELITLRVLQYLPNVLTHFNEKSGYKIHSSLIAGTTKYLRPINQRLFIYSALEFESKFSDFELILGKLKTRNNYWSENERELIDSVLYTIQQSIGAGFDLLVNPNSARKHVGNRFEELIRCIFSEIGISNKSTVLKIPYETEKGQKDYRCENDIILSPYSKVKSTNKHLDENEIVVSVKTTSKDRMGKMFIDKILLERFVNHPQKVIGIFLNDVQRKETDNISHTLVSGLFMVYSNFLTELEGIYYLDPPPNASIEPYNKYMNTFSELITKDIWELLSP
ncbi:hypothetical protein POV26_11460 [Aequorivita todarodis]|uniref:hypothetical protein n=1 Tax=Aequorivita todarodis TaxID=2036821 RepID=UPI002350FFF9|nr:hypothetical protein [Aequorivita todarodis]MDC8001657.1 hypothetical protein [Aequorivita todarodis]